MLIKNARISFPAIFAPKAFQDGGDPKYSATFILAKNDPQVKAIEKAMQEVAKAKWGDKAAAVYKQVKLQGKLALHDGNTKVNESGEVMDGFEDAVFFNASNDKRPGVYDRDRSPLTQADGKPYAGCYVNVMVEFWAQDNKYGKRINASLGGLQFAKDGEAFGGGGRVAQADDFDLLDEDDTEADTFAATGTDDFLD